MGPDPQRLTVDIEWLRKQSKNWVTLADRMNAVKQGSESVRSNNVGIEQPRGSSLTNIATFINAYDAFVTNFQDRVTEGVNSCHAVATTITTVTDEYRGRDEGSAANIQGSSRAPGAR